MKQRAKISQFLDYIYVTFCDDVELECNRLVHRLDKNLQNAKPGWLRETVPSYNTLAVVINRESLYDSKDAISMVEQLLESPASDEAEETDLWELPVLYGGEFGPDLKDVAREKNLTEDEVIQIHTSRVYTCYMLGFTPGFVYLGDVDDRLVVERLKTPRTSVPEGSVGLAGKQTGFYGIDSPGGWRIIGRLKKRTFDVRRNPPSIVKPGDRVRFVSVRADA